jgi:hypothetical protein
MTTRQSIVVMMVFGLELGFAPAAWADPASDACAALADARNALYLMINAKDKSTQDGLNANKHEARFCASRYDRRGRQGGSRLQDSLGSVQRDA